jgi:hypothetical protein
MTGAETMPKHHRVLIIGSAPTMEDDVRTALRLFKPDAVYAVNGAGRRYAGKVDVWCSIHADNFATWIESRAALEKAQPVKRIVSTFEHPGVTEVYPIMWYGQRNTGSSGLYAIRHAIDEGATHIVLAGIPLDGSGGWNAGSYQTTWSLLGDRLMPVVRSMSGWTRETFGEPTKAWLAGETAEKAEA